MSIQSLTIRQYIEGCLSFRYLSNISIIVAIISYYTRAYPIFFITIPLIITNLIIIIILQWFNTNELIKGVFKLDNNSSLETQINTNSQFQFILLNTIWHIAPVIWLYGILNRDNIIQIFRPNFMGIFLECAFIGIVYFYCSSIMKLYGNINYIWYGGIYFIVLFITCIIIFNGNLQHY